MKTWFLNLQTQSKLIVGFGAIMGLLLLTLIVTSIGMQQTRNNFNLALNLATLKNNLNEQRMATVIMLANPDKTIQADAKQKIIDITKENDDLLKNIVSQGHHDQRFSQELKDLTQERNEYNKIRDGEVVPLLMSGKYNEARTSIFGVQNQRYVRVSNLTTSIIQQVEQSAVKEANIEFFIFAGVFAVTFLCFVLIVRILSQNIGEPLKHIAKLSNRISLGDLTVTTIPLQRNDEIGVLTNSFHQMTQTLRNIANIAQKIAEGDLRVNANPQSDQDILGNAFYLMINNLKKLTADITEAANVVGTATSEISTSAMQLVTSASETATAVSETTGTIEEVRQTAQHSSQKAKSIVENVQKTSEVAQLGKAATEESAVGISRIGDQMELIAQSMQQLSEQSQMIGDILATVDDLAQQSNLLAVNAAIEAAKAGEQGKGFSVVAQEIKALSEQSKQATNQVRTILNDIQKATGVAVMATEQGTKVVDTGRQKSNEAGDSILVLTNNVLGAAEEVTQIATISHQQLSGVEQAATAMENIREASNQNVESTRQLESAAQNLKELGTHMKELVGRYKL